VAGVDPSYVRGISHRRHDAAEPVAEDGFCPEKVDLRQEAAVLLQFIDVWSDGVSQGCKDTNDLALLLVLELGDLVVEFNNF